MPMCVSQQTLRSSNLSPAMWRFGVSQRHQLCPICPALTWITDEVDDLKSCEPSDCDMQLAAENIEKFRSRINWSSDDPRAQVNRLHKRRCYTPCSSISKWEIPPSPHT